MKVPFGDGNWSITYKDENIDLVKNGLSFKDYVEKGLPTYNSLENFIKFVLPSIKTIDANGYLCVRPKEIDYIEDEEGNLVIDSQLNWLIVVAMLDCDLLVLPRR